MLGYRPGQVDAALAAAEGELAERERGLRARDARLVELEAVAQRLSELVVERERELRELREELADARAVGEEQLRALAGLGAHLEEVRAQAHGQATRIRLGALRDAARLSDRVTELARKPAEAGEELVRAMEEMASVLSDGGEGGLPDEQEGGEVAAGSNGRPERAREPADLFKGLVHVEVGPLRDFSQLVSFEDAARSIGATGEISIKRFSEGRATMAVQLREPVALLRELEERCDLEFEVRDMRRDRVILNVGSGA